MKYKVKLTKFSLERSRDSYQLFHQKTMLGTMVWMAEIAPISPLSSTVNCLQVIWTPTQGHLDVVAVHGSSLDGLDWQSSHSLAWTGLAW